MRRLRSANSPKMSSTIDISDFSPSDRNLRSSSLRSPEQDAPLSNQEMRTPRKQKRSYVAISDDTDSFIVHGAQWGPGRRVKAYSSPSQEPSQLPTPAASPGNISGRTKANGTPLVPLLDMPIEVHQRICEYLPIDKDVANYARVCVKTSQYVTSSVWYKRFLATFDPIEGASVDEIHHQYKERRGFEKLFVDFTCGAHPLHARFLNMITDVIVQSDMRVNYDTTGRPHHHARNHMWLRTLMADLKVTKDSRRGTNLINEICNLGSLLPYSARSCGRTTSPWVTAIQLCLTHLTLGRSVCIERARRVLNSQTRIYRPEHEEPIFKGRYGSEINFPFLLNIVNFWKFHFKTHEGEGHLAHIFCSLGHHERPRAWYGKVKQGTQELGKHWKGTFTYLSEEDLAHIRVKECAAVVDEVHHDNDGFQDLTLFFDVKGHPELQFTERMEEELQGMPDPGLRNEDGSTIEHKDFFGLGYNGSHYHFNGRIHGMPAQAGIPGFQRINMMVCLPDEKGNYGYGHSSYWGYEGCVLPGNQIMLGRWWRAYDDEEEPTYSGPFIFWAVDGSREDQLKDATSAVSFLESVANRMV